MSERSEPTAYRRHFLVFRNTFVLFGVLGAFGIYCLLLLAFATGIDPYESRFHASFTFALTKVGFGEYSDRLARFLTADNVLTHIHLLTPPLAVVFLEIARSWQRERAFWDSYRGDPVIQARRVFVLVALSTIAFQGLAIALSMPDAYVSDDPHDGLMVGRYFLPPAHIAGHRAVHTALRVAAPLSVLLAISCAIAFVYRFSWTRWSRLAGAFASVAFVPFLAGFGLSVSELLPKDAQTASWAALVLWFLIVALGVYAVVRTPTSLRRKTGFSEFAAEVERDGKGFVADCPDFPEAGGRGRTEDESLFRLAQAIRRPREDLHDKHIAFVFGKKDRQAFEYVIALIREMVDRNMTSRTLWEGKPLPSVNTPEGSLESGDFGYIVYRLKGLSDLNLRSSRVPMNGAFMVRAPGGGKILRFNTRFDNKGGSRVVHIEMEKEALSG